MDWIVVLWDVMNCDEKYGEMWWVENWDSGKWNELHCCNENCALICDCEWNGWLLGILGLCDRESWAGRIATHMWGMARLSRADSLIGGHLYWEMKWYEKRKEKKWEKKRNDMRKEMKCEEMWGWVIRSWYEMIDVIEIDWWLVTMIELWITLIGKYYDWIWTVIGPGGILNLCKCEVVCVK